MMAILLNATLTLLLLFVSAICAIYFTNSYRGLRGFKASITAQKKQRGQLLTEAYLNGMRRQKQSVYDAVMDFAIKLFS